ncbi:MAG: hypothetical protein GY756_12900 [bacterium]|nr:hypothetical protein [bacterium]
MNYIPKNNNIFVDLYIDNHNITIIAKLDNNYCYWISQGKLNSTFIEESKLIARLMNNPNKIIIHDIRIILKNKYKTSLEIFNDCFFKYHIRKQNNQMYLNGVPVENMNQDLQILHQKNIIQFSTYCNLNNEVEIIEKLDTFISKFKDLYQDYEDAAYNRSEEYRQEFKDFLELIKLSKSKKIISRISTCSSIISKMYNLYMTIAR